MAQTLDQRRAQHAWVAVQKAVKLNEEAKKKYGGQAKKLPMRIMAAGLGQALAFLDAKKYAPDLLKDIADWVLDKRWVLAQPESKIVRPKTTNIMVQRIVQEDADFLRRATDETLAYLQWLNRFAEAEGLTEEQ